MKSLNQYINEKLKVSKNQNQYNYCPETNEELVDLVDQLLKERGWEADLNDIDVSNITDMSSLFYYYTDFNGDISKWDVSNVTSMEGIFYWCKKFEGKGLENWNVSNVTNMNDMFWGCKKLDCNLSKWDVSDLYRHLDMFEGCPIKDEYKPKFKK